MKIFRKSVSILFTALLPLIIILTVIIGEILIRDTRSKSLQSASDFTEEWQDLSGETVSTADLPKGKVIIRHSLEGIDTNDKEFCFKTSNANIKVFFDAELAYDYKFVPYSSLFGKSYGVRVHMVAIPNGVSTVTLELEPLYEKSAAGISLISIEKSGTFINDLYQSGLPGFALCTLITLIGIMMLIIGVITQGISERSNIDFFSLGAFSILTGIYSANETLILQLFTERPDVVRFCAAIALMFVSFFPVSFMANVTHHRDTVLLPIMFTLNISNFVITTLLSLLGISDVALMLAFSHINIVAAVIMTFYLMLRAVRKKTNDIGFLHTVITGMSFALVGAGIDLLRYVIFRNRILGNSIFTRVGVLVFVVFMGIQLMRERTRLAVEREKSLLMEKLAYTDSLTELKNRLAFHVKENEIRTEHISCNVVQLDINNLKKVNDEYGHAEGDRHIISAANIIRNCFSDIGTCYRTGGDEFIVIAEKGDIKDVISALTAMEKDSEEYNNREEPPVPMQIAYGYAHYTAQTDMLEAAEKLADQRMYEKKKQMKKLQAIKA